MIKHGIKVNKSRKTCDVYYTRLRTWHEYLRLIKKKIKKKVIFLSINIKKSTIFQLKINISNKYYFCDFFID